MSTNSEAQVSGTAQAQQGANYKRNLGLLSLTFMGLGSIIGSGWLFGAYNASIQTGPSAIWSWVIGAVMVLIIGLCFAEIAPMFPVSGGVVRYPHLTWGAFSSYSLGFVMWVSVAAVPAIEVLATLTYATKYAPFTHSVETSSGVAHVLTPLGIGVGVILMAIFTLLNYFGVKLFAQINDVLVWWKLLVIVLVIITFIFTVFTTTRMGSMANYTSHGFAPNGVGAIFTTTATAGIVFAYTGFRQPIELAGESKNPKRNIPLALILSIGVSTILYLGLQFVFTIGVPTTVLQQAGSWTGLTFEDDFGPLAALSTMGGLGFLAIILYIDAIVSPADAGLIYSATASRITYALAKNGTAPHFLTRNNRHGIPGAGLILIFIVGLILLLPFPSWQQMVGFITSGSVISFASGPLVLGALRKSHPDHPRPFKLVGGHVIPVIAFYITTMIIYWTGWEVNSKLFIAILIGYIVLAGFHLFTKDKSKLAPLKLKHSLPWVAPWFIGLALISFFMDTARNTPEGSTSTPPVFWWAFLVNAVLTAIVYTIAMKTMLPKEEIDEHINAFEHEADSSDEVHD